MRDIDLIIEKVTIKLPEIGVWQPPKSCPSDDNGIWYFSLPDVKQSIQIESSYGVCPFIVETEEQCSYDARTANTIDEAVEMIVEYLKSKMKE